MTMPQRLRRLLMFWLVIALQAMTPFIHAHAGAPTFSPLLSLPPPDHALPPALAPPLN